jgi:hypothetical protein
VLFDISRANEVFCELGFMVSRSCMMFSDVDDGSLVGVDLIKVAFGCRSADRWRGGHGDCRI